RDGRVGRRTRLAGPRDYANPDHWPRGQCRVPARRDKDLTGDSGDSFRVRGAGKPAKSLFPRRKGDLAMQSENKMFDDFVKMVNGMAGTFAGMGREAEASA